MAAVSARAGLDDLCRRFLNGDEKSATQFMLEVRPLVMTVARKYARGLAEDQLEEVMGETMLHLLQLAGSGYDSMRGSAVTFVGLVARRAARDVSAQYTPPGRQTRPPAKRDVEALEEYRRLSHVEPLEAVDEEQEPMAPSFEAMVGATLDAAFIMSIAPPPVAHVLQRVCYDEVSMAEAAGEVNLSRFAVHRLIAGFREMVVAA